MNLPEDEQLLLAMGHAMAGFVGVVAAVEPQQWELPSPCDGWTVFDVVDHVVMGDRFAAKVLSGASMEEARNDLVGLDRALTDPIGEVAAAAQGALEAFGSSLDVVVDHPIGMIPARRFLGFRIIDQLGHTWDVARGVRQPIALDPAVVEVGLTIAHAEEQQLRKSEHFDTPEGGLPDSQDATDAFLHLIGRKT